MAKVGMAGGVAKPVNISLQWPGGPMRARAWRPAVALKVIKNVTPVRPANEVLRHAGKASRPVADNHASCARSRAAGGSKSRAASGKESINGIGTDYEGG